MGCNCAKGKNGSRTYVLTDLTGKKHVYASESEALAAKNRIGGVVTVGK